MTKPLFKLHAPYKPAGDQPEAIEKLSSGLSDGNKEQVLLGVTGSGKTFTVANVIAQQTRPVLVVSHNKTLAAQLYGELKEFFPENAVEYFVSYYDYYQPEAYIPHTDTFIEKDASINDDLDRLRLSATSSILSRADTIIVSSVSCIYGLGSPEDWQGMLVQIEVGQKIDRDELLTSLIDIQYSRDAADLVRGNLRAHGDMIEVFPTYSEHPFRIEMFGDEIEKIIQLDPETNQSLFQLDKLAVYPAKHFVTTSDRLTVAMETIRAELKIRLKELESLNKLLEMKRLESRVNYDLEMLKEVGYCSGIENYSRHITGKKPGEPPASLIDYFPKDFLIVVDESHVTIPQFRGMYNGDAARKRTLVEHGFRLPSALDNRPLKFPEFQKRTDKMVYISATPNEYELDRADRIAEQIVRPTGLLDPGIEVRPREDQINDLISEVRKRAEKKERVLITTLTKRMAEDLSHYLKEVGIRSTYLHSELDTFERMEVLRDLRMQKYDCIVGINLLREGLDLPEVSLVIILDADKEGFLRSEVALIQTAGRAARHVNGTVIMYADKETNSMKKAIGETVRRRKIQKDYNKKHGITPKSVVKALQEGIGRKQEAEKLVYGVVGESGEEHGQKDYVDHLKRRMVEAAKNLDFQKAASLRDKLKEIAPEALGDSDQRKNKIK
jgi:excinuclease ABC subunit B